MLRSLSFRVHQNLRRHPKSVCPLALFPVFLSCLFSSLSLFLSFTYLDTCSVASIVPDSVRPYGLQPLRLLCPWNSPGKNTGVGCHALLQGIFLTQGLNPGLLCLLHCRQILLSTEPPCCTHTYILKGGSDGVEININIILVKKMILIQDKSRTSLVAQMVKTACQRRRPEFDPWVREYPWRREWLTTPEFLPRESHGQRGLQSMGSQRVGHN